MKLFKKTFLSLMISSLSLGYAQAKGAGTVGGLILEEPAGADAAALGEAFTAKTDAISAFSYNPASLGSLKTGQASFMYEKGLADDAYGHFMLGSPSKIGHLGLSVGYYDAGKFNLTEENLKTTEVSAQKDLKIAAGYSNKLGAMNWGFANILSTATMKSTRRRICSRDFATIAKSSGRASRKFASRATFRRRSNSSMPGTPSARPG